MSPSLLIPMIWAQAFLPGVPQPFRAAMAWATVLGEPLTSISGPLYGVILWVKIVSLFCLLGWVASWLSAAFRERTVARGTWLDLAALVALAGAAGTVLLSVLEANQKIPVYKIAGIYTVTLLGVLCAAILFAWVEAAVWSAVRRVGTKYDLMVLFGIHLAMVVGLVVGFAARNAMNTIYSGTVVQTLTVWDGLFFGVRMSATYMGYVVLLRAAAQVFREVLAVRWRRLYAIAGLSVTESVRRMWAPWVVIVVFCVVLAFTHWFLQPPRAAEMGRLYVGTLTLLCSLLLTVMVTLLTPLSLPQDIQNQTIYTVVSKPVRRIELVWGRMLGFMTLVTLLIFAFGGISLVYLSRTVGGAIATTEAAALKASQQNRVTEAKQRRDEAEQIRTRMTARVPTYGSLTFLDSKGTPHVQGIDVGQEQSMREPRSHIEGATPATAIWTYGVVPDPRTPPGRRPIMLDHRIPVASMIQAGSVEALNDQTYQVRYQIIAAEQELGQPNLPSDRGKALSDTIARLKTELERANDAYGKMKADADALDAKVAQAEKANNASEAASLRAQSAALHSPAIPMEMTFNVYRTTKGRIGEPVFAELEATNPRTGAQYRNIFAIREYYTNRQFLPASILAGSAGSLRVEIRCISPTQYLGMAESDLFLLARSGDFGPNFMKGLFGVWLQAMVLTAIGVFAGTFLSWPVALLTTIAFFVAGQVAFSFLLEFTAQSLIGGGPFESLIRLLSHDNQMSDLAPTLAVVTAKTLDSIVMPVMSRLVYIVPNFAALDVSNTVADGFAVPWSMMVGHTLLALAYALPFSIAGYFILKNREVAA